MIYYTEHAWESWIHFYCRQKRAFITDRIKPRFLSAETQNRVPFLPFPYSLHRFGFYLWTEIAEDGTVRAGHGRGKRAGQLFVHNRREKIQLDLASSGLVFFFFFFPSSCSMSDSLPERGYGFTHHRVLYCLIATNSQGNGEKKTNGLQ